MSAEVALSPVTPGTSAAGDLSAHAGSMRVWRYGDGVHVDTPLVVVHWPDGSQTFVAPVGSHESVIAATCTQREVGEVAGPLQPSSTSHGASVVRQRPSPVP